MVLRDLGVISSLYGLKASCTVIVVGCGLQDAFSMGTAEVQTGTRVVLLQSNLFALCSNYGKWRPIFPKAPMMTTLPNLSGHHNLLCLLVCQLFAFFRHLRPTPHTSQGPWLRKLWEPKSKCLKAVPTHLQKYVVWSRTLISFIWEQIYFIMQTSTLLQRWMLKKLKNLGIIFTHPPLHCKEKRVWRVWPLKRGSSTFEKSFEKSTLSRSSFSHLETTA